MIKTFFSITAVMLMAATVHAQEARRDESKFHSQSFGIQGGLTLLENPFVLYPVVNLSYSRTVLGYERHQLAIFPQIGAIVLPTIETKFLTSLSLQYKYISEKRFEANVFLGVNYQLRSLAYDRYEFRDNALVNKGSVLSQFGPTAGLNIGYKIIKKQNFSISPFIGISATKLNDNYVADFFGGYKPSIAFGFNFNK